MKTINPRFKSRGIEGNYGAGYIGFSYKDDNVVSQGIAWFTREEYNGIVPSHTFYVVDHRKIIEATGEGVHFTDINHYFNEPHYVVFFKKPLHLSSDYIFQITDWLHKQLGKSYDYSAILGFLLKVERLWFLRKYPSIFDSRDEFVCSELVASALNQIPEYSNLFPLSEYHPSKIDPLMLFRSELFEEWNFDI